MKSDRDFERAAAEWLDAGSDWTAPHVIDAVLLAVRTTPQERGFRIPWRTTSMRNLLYAAGAVGILAVAGVAAFYTLGPGSNVGSGPPPSPAAQPSQAQSPTPGPTTQPTLEPSPTVPTASPIDTTSWTAYTSERYGFTIGHPADWTVVPAARDWTMATDAADWLSTAQEAFRGPNVRVSAWSVAVDRSTTPETSAAVAAWVEEYCEELGNTPCTGIQERATPLCVELRDCHPGLLMQFEEDVEAFFTGGIDIDGGEYGDTMVVVAVWWDESAPAVAPYGGAQKLLEAFLSTMNVWTEAARDECIRADAVMQCEEDAFPGGSGRPAATP